MVTFLVLKLGDIDKCLVMQLCEIHELTHNSGKSQQLYCQLPGFTRDLIGAS